MTQLASVILTLASFSRKYPEVKGLVTAHKQLGEYLSKSKVLEVFVVHAD
jgi:hypothetical protein